MTWAGETGNGPSVGIRDSAILDILTIVVDNVELDGIVEVSGNRWMNMEIQRTHTCVLMLNHDIPRRGHVG